MAQTVIDPATLAAVAGVKADIAAISKGIKSVQRGVSTGGTALSEAVVTISSVNTAKSMVTLLSAGLSAAYQLRLISSTSLGVFGYYESSGRPVSWEVVEWY